MAAPYIHARLAHTEMRVEIDKPHYIQLEKHLPEFMEAQTVSKEQYDKRIERSLAEKA